MFSKDLCCRQVKTRAWLGKVSSKAFPLNDIKTLENVIKVNVLSANCYHMDAFDILLFIMVLSLISAHTSGIHSIYVKSLLLPDKKRETKRKTEDIRVDSSEAHIQWKDKSSHQYIFMPSNFKFKRALEYNKINADIVKERTLQIEVLITQRYTHRSFLIGMLNIPLKKAVKKVVREKVALIPCMNHTIPSNMKVYCASELDISSNKVFYSTPNVQITIPEELDNASDKAASNPDLQPEKYSPSVEVNMTDTIRGLPTIPKLNLDESHLDESGYSSEFQMSMPGELDSPDSDKVVEKKSFALQDRVITMPKDEGDSGNVSKVLEGVKEKLSGKTRAVTKIANGIEVTDLDEEEPVSVSVETDTELKNEVSVSMKPDGQDTSRPETPTWDYYDVPTDIVTLDDEMPPSPWKEGAAPVMLPMETNLSIHQSKDTISSKDGGAKHKEKIKKKSKKKIAPPIPGKAIPLVPEIVIVNADTEYSEKKLNNHPEAKITICDSITKSLPKHTDSANEDNLDHIVEMSQMKSISEKARDVSNIFLRTEGSPVNTAGEARAICVIEPEDSSESRENLSSNKISLPIPKPRTRKLRKVKEGGSKSGLVTPKSYQTGSLGKLQAEKSSRLSGESSKSDLSEIKVINDKAAVSGDSTSFVVDMDKLSFAQSGSHVVEVEDDISITELSENSKLFSDTSVTYPVSFDVESGTESYKLPERVSPTKYMIPVQVYMEDDTSCDESLSTDRSERSLTIRNVPETSSKV